MSSRRARENDDPLAVARQRARVEEPREEHLVAQRVHAQDVQKRVDEVAAVAVLLDAHRAHELLVPVHERRETAADVVGDGRRRGRGSSRSRRRHRDVASRENL
eukprot:30612-Pelagococcus_subviridis.AAC.5